MLQELAVRCCVLAPDFAGVDFGLIRLAVDIAAKCLVDEQASLGLLDADRLEQGLVRRFWRLCSRSHRAFWALYLALLRRLALVLLRDRHSSHPWVGSCLFTLVGLARRDLLRLAERELLQLQTNQGWLLEQILGGIVKLGYCTFASKGKLADGCFTQGHVNGCLWLLDGSLVVCS